MITPLVFSENPVYKIIENAGHDRFQARCKLCGFRTRWYDVPAQAQDRYFDHLDSHSEETL